MKVTLKILLSVAIIVLAYMCYRSIMTPIEFNNEKEARDNCSWLFRFHRDNTAC